MTNCPARTFVFGFVKVNSILSGCTGVGEVVFHNVAPSAGVNVVGATGTHGFTVPINYL